MARPPHRAEAHGCPSGQRRAEPGLQPGNGRAAVKPRLQLVLAAVCFSTAGAAIKWCAFGASQIAAFRALVAALAIVVLIPDARRRWSGRVVLVGGAYAAAGLLFVFANKLTTAANTVFLQATNPLFVVALAPWLLRERVRAADLALMGVLAAGLALLFVGGQRPFATAPDPGLANVFLSRAITRVPALEASLFLLVEPVLSPVWAWLAHGETPGPLAVIGGAVILTATALKAWTDTQVVAA